MACIDLNEEQQKCVFRYCVALVHGREGIRTQVRDEAKEMNSVRLDVLLRLISDSGRDFIIEFVRSMNWDISNPKVAETWKLTCDPIGQYPEIP